MTLPSPEPSADLVAALAEAVGPAHVSTTVADRLANARGVWPVELKAMRRWLAPNGRGAKGETGVPLPGCVVWPGDAAQVSAVLRIADRFRVPVVPFGSGSGIVGGTTAVAGCISLDTKRLTGFRLDEDSLVVHAGAGVFGIDLEDRLNAAGCSLGHFPQSLHSSTVGGWVATRASGTFSTLHGNIEDRVVGLEVVLADGAILRTHPSPRSATGPDLAEALLGSEGTLGLITEVALWVHPLPARRIWASYAFPGFLAALAGVRAMLQTGLRPAVVRLYDSAETAHKFGALDLPAETSLLVLVFEGPAEVAEAQAMLGGRLCQSAGGRDLGKGPAEAWWRTRFDTSGLVLANARAGGVADAIEVAALWRDLPGVYDAMVRAAERHAARVHAHVSHVYPSGGGLYVIFAAEAADDLAVTEKYERIVADLLAACHDAGGSISHHHGIGRAKTRWQEAEHGAAGLAALRAIKRALDPHGLLNPGVLGLEA